MNLELPIRGRSMGRMFRAGDRLVASLGAPVRSGDVVLVLCEGTVRAHRLRADGRTEGDRSGIDPPGFILGRVVGTRDPHGRLRPLPRWTGARIRALFRRIASGLGGHRR